MHDDRPFGITDGDGGCRGDERAASTTRDGAGLAHADEIIGMGYFPDELGLVPGSTAPRPLRGV